MGVLEDAIRDHLELQRKHGASDEELLEKEAEALGPARREFETPAVEEPLVPEPEVPEPEIPEPEIPEPEAPEPDVVEAETLEPEPPTPEPPAPPPVVEGTIDEQLDFAEDEEVDRLAPEQRPPRDLDFD